MAFTLLLMFTIGLSAQTKPPQQQKPPADRAKDLVTYLASRMTLTQKKQDAMIPVYTTYFTKVASVRQSHDPSVMESSKKELDASLKKILTQDEIKQVDKLIEERMNSKPKH